TKEIMTLASPPTSEATGAHFVVPPKIAKGMADIATHVWRAKAKMLDATSGEVKEDMKRVYRHVEGVIDALKQMDIEIKDHTGDAFDYGMPLTVVTSQPTEGITREIIVETLRPTIYWQNNIVQRGEIVLGTPVTLKPTS